MTKNTSGILLAVGAALSVSNVYLFGKAALNHVHLAQFGFYWFGLGLIWNFIYFFANGKYKTTRNLTINNRNGLILISILEMFATLFFFLAIKTVENPAVVSFLANLNPLFVVVLGIVILKERFSKFEFFGMGITLSGAILISMAGVSGENNYFVDGTQYIVISAIFYSLSTLVAKKQLKSMDASYLAISRIVLLFFFSIVSLIVLNLPVQIDQASLLNIGIGSVLGPFFGSILGYMALKRIEMSKAIMVRTVRSLFVLVGAFFYFGSFPTTLQIMGGILTMTGVVLISFGKLKILHRKPTVK